MDHQRQLRIGNVIQSSLKKVHSVDYASSQQQQQQQQQQHQLQQQQQQHVATRTNAPLMHSVSIVVELAKEPFNAACSAEDTANITPMEIERGGKRASSGGAGTGTGFGTGGYRRSVNLLSSSGSSANEDLEDDEEEEDDDDDDDEGAECLSSELARRVVLVDEADKILRRRVSSAEANFELPSFSMVASKGPAPPIPARSSIKPRARLMSLATTCSGVGGFPSGPSGELAERGELSALGMRRNTHHQVGVYLARGQPDRPALPPLQPTRRSGSAQLERQPFSEGLTLATRRHQQQQQQQQQQRPSSATTSSNWCKRRQSLQIGFLTSSCLSKSLTEEELRGEREFNEQVRSVLRSPDLLGAVQEKQQQLKSAGSLEASTGNWRKEQPATIGDGSKPSIGIVKQRVCNQQQKQQQPHQRRRVSFSSIDPVLLVGKREKEEQSSATEEKSCCSFAFLQHSQSQQIDDSRRVQLQSSRFVSLETTAASGLDNSEQSENINSNNNKQQITYLPRGRANPDHLHLSRKRHSLATCSQLTRGLPGFEVATSVGSIGGKEREEDSPYRLISLAKASRKMNDNSVEGGRACEGRSGEGVVELRQTQMEPLLTTRPDDPSDRQNTPRTTIAAIQRPAANQERDDSRVQSIMANAKLRQEEFARLLEEHEQIVNEINRVETKISGSQTSLPQQQQQGGK